MKLSLTRLAAFAGRHWLRLGLVGCALLLLSQKQIDFNVRLGHPAPAESPAVLPRPDAEPLAEEETPLLMSADGPALAQAGGFFSRFNFFGGGEEDHYDLLTRSADTDVQAFVTRFRHVAEAEQEKFGIPASITLATGLLYGRAGQATAVRDANNFFGLDCGGDWRGATARVGGACLRKYETAWTGFRDFSLYVSSGRYAALRQFGPRDYRRWAAGLEELGFNGNEDLAGQLQRTIDRYQLFRYD